MDGGRKKYQVKKFIIVERFKLFDFLQNLKSNQAFMKP